jgi:hypothetical protein
MATTAGATARGFVFPGDTDAADVPAKMKALADSVEAYFTGASSFGGVVTTPALVVDGSTAGEVDLRDQGATAGVRRSRIMNDGGVTTLDHPNDANSSITNVGLSYNHSTGVIDFPNGLTQSSRAGKSIIATTETRTNTAFGTLTTPDQVSVTIAAGNLIAVQYYARWSESVSAAAQAAIFIGSNQLQVARQAAGPDVQAASTVNTNPINTNEVLTSCPIGLVTSLGASMTNAEVTTGQAMGYAGISGSAYGFVVGSASAIGSGANVLGSPVYIKGLAAGTYTISVQFKASSGTVTVSNRDLRVRAVAD